MENEIPVFSVACLQVEVKFADKLAHQGTRIRLSDGDSRTRFLNVTAAKGLLHVLFVGPVSSSGVSEIFNTITFNMDKVLSFETSGPVAKEQA